MRIYFYTFGCKTNQAETEQMKSAASKSGAEIVTQENLANIFVVNSCTVTRESDRQCKQYLRHLIRQYPAAKIVLTGCYVERDKIELNKLFPEITILGNEEKGNLTNYLPQDYGYTETKKTSSNYARAFIKIQDGCDAFCSYCIVPIVRPKIVSSNIKNILQEINEKIDAGTKEVVLTGIRLGKFAGRDKQGTVYDLVGLLKKIITVCSVNRIRLSSIEVTEITDSLLKTMAESRNKICSHLHIPLQSGDDEVLKKMNRGYTTDQFKNVAHQIRKILPDCGITTDVIVGFPGETDNQFETTYNFIKEMEFSRLHVFSYSPRPGTRADLFKEQVEPNLKKKRSKLLQDLDQQLRTQFAMKYLGKSIPVLLESKDADGKVAGYSDNYIRIKSGCGKENQIISLKIVKIDGNMVFGMDEINN